MHVLVSQVLSFCDISEQKSHVFLYPSQPAQVPLFNLLHSVQYRVKIMEQCALNTHSNCILKQIIYVNIGFCYSFVLWKYPSEISLQRILLRNSIVLPWIRSHKVIFRCMTFIHKGENEWELVIILYRYIQSALKQNKRQSFYH